ncbi:MAG: DUF58 domain-containing protein [Gammaproteobacteria bacterium]
MESGVYASLDDLVRLKYQAQGYSFLPNQPIHSLLAGRHASRMRGRGLNFEEIRTYLAGDDIRNIDWRVTARTGKPHTRVYTEERDRPALFVVDQRLNMFFGSKVSMKSVTAAEATALGAWRVLSQGDRVGGFVFNDSEIKDIRPHRSQRRVLELLRTVIKQNQDLRVTDSSVPEPAQFNHVLERVARAAKHDHLITLITDMDGYDDDSEQLLTRLSQNNDVLVVLIYDPLETNLPDMGRLVIGEGDLQLEFDSADQQLRETFAEAFNSNLESRRQILMRRGIPVLPVNTAQPVIEQVQLLLGYRPKAAVSRVLAR